jgi:uncharacterized protein with PIN domain
MVLEYPVPESRCPVCEYPMNAATAFNENDPVPPVADDLSVCMNCGEILKFSSDLTVVSLEEDEIFGIIKDCPDAYHALMSVKVAIENR